MPQPRRLFSRDAKRMRSGLTSRGCPRRLSVASHDSRRWGVGSWGSGEAAQGHLDVVHSRKTAQAP